MGLLSNAEAEAFVGPTRDWLEKAVIGLNLCPFAQAVHAQGRIRWVVSDARDEATLLGDLAAECRHLADAGRQDAETTLLIHPFVLGEFDAFNAFLDPAEACLAELGLDGVLQIASFHPAYQFAGTDADDITNRTNHSPFPTLHLLREASLDEALERFPNPESIYERNVEVLRALGHEGWAKLGLGSGGKCPHEGHPGAKPDAGPGNPA